MSRTLNKVMLIGNVGKHPDLKHTPSGIPVTSFRLATSETWKDREGNVREHTDWHTVVAWRGLAEVIQKLVTKGSRVYIEGKLQTRTFEDKGGIKKHIVEILADNMLLLENKKPGFKDSHDEEVSTSEYHYDDYDEPNYPEDDFSGSYMREEKENRSSRDILF